MILFVLCHDGCLSNGLEPTPVLVLIGTVHEYMKNSLLRAIQVELPESGIAPGVLQFWLWFKIQTYHGSVCSAICPLRCVVLLPSLFSSLVEDVFYLYRL